MAASDKRQDTVEQYDLVHDTIGNDLGRVEVGGDLPGLQRLRHLRQDLPMVGRKTPKMSIEDSC